MDKIINYFKLIRIKHWIKNGLVFLPLFFAHLISFENICVTTIAFFAFSLMASVIYIINDIKDVEKDRKHPRKKHRPIASEKISIKEGIAVAILLFVGSIFLNYLATNKIVSEALYVLIAYLIINIFYSFGRKRYSNIRCYIAFDRFYTKSILWSIYYKC